MDARHENLEECTKVSALECPGLQDLTTSVDFTEVAEAGRSLGWDVSAYGPLFFLELSDAGGGGHIVERAGGFGTDALTAWYLKPESEPWASFKVLVQHRRGGPGANWTLGGLAPDFWGDTMGSTMEDL